MTLRLAIALLAVTAFPACGHRLDEYLQNTLLSVEKTELRAQMVLTPGVAVFPLLMAVIDSNGDGVISEAEQRAYTARVLHDLSLSIDGVRLSPAVTSLVFPALAEMKEGSGEIKIEFRAALPEGGGDRNLVFENHHQDSISAWQVNCLISRDPDLQIRSQLRNYTQSVYQLRYTQAGARAGNLFFASFPASQALPGVVALFLIARLFFLIRQRLARN